MRSVLRIIVIGALVLATAVAHGQQLPLELWYGYLVGSARGELSFSDGKNQTGEFALSGGMGQQRKWQLFFPQALRLGLAADSNKVDWPSQLGGALQITSRLRYTLNYLSYDRDEQIARRHIYSFPPGDYVDVTNLYRATNWAVDQSAFWWSTDSVEVTPERSMIVLLGGPRLGVGDHIIRLSQSSWGQKYEFNPERQLPDTALGQTMTETVDRRAHSGALEWLVGLGPELEGQIFVDYERSRTNAANRNQMATLNPQSLSSQYRLMTNTVEMSEPSFGVRPAITYVLGRRAWVYVEPGYGYRIKKNQSGYQESIIRSGEIVYNNHTEAKSTAKTYLLNLHADWLSRFTEFSPQFLLDNFSGYYSQPLQAGTFHWRFDLALTADRENTHVTYRDFGSSTPPDRSYDEERNESLLGLSATYYFRPRVRLAAQLSSRRTITYDERQTPTKLLKHRHSLDLRFEVSNIVYDPLKRREISWVEVEPLDYIYGPLLRPHDYRVSFRLVPPTLEHHERSEDAGFLGVDFGDFDDNWTVEMFAARGIIDRFEGSLSVSYRDSESQFLYIYFSRDAITTVAVSAAWQPSRLMRLTSRMWGEYWDSGRSLALSAADADNNNRWHLNVNLNIVFP